jgi:anti-sigma regulatory factor (Ser/Thr protein kinase)
VEVREHARVEIRDPSGSGQARRVAGDLARRHELADDDRSRLAIVVTELATNVAKHGKGGEILLCGIRSGRCHGVGVLALDTGPGIHDPALALRDGYSTSATAGTGLGAVRRQATRFDLYSASGAGTAVFAEVWSERRCPERACLIGGVNVPFPGETVSGDGWRVAHEGPRALALLVDGLGHGPVAAEAAGVALESFDKRRSESPTELLADLHAALRPTRGAAIAVAALDVARGLVRFAGIGNVSGVVAADTSLRGLVSSHGTAGYQASHIREVQVPWTRGASLILHSDGIATHWLLERYPGLTRRHPALLAGVLYRDFRRGRDDASVLVLRDAA